MKDTTSLHRTRDGETLFVRHWPLDEPAATILVVHGLSEHIGRYEHVADHFLSHGMEFLGYDHRGHGQSTGERVDVSSFDEYLDDMEIMVREARRPGVPLIAYGHSMGGLIATRYAQSGRPQPDAYVLSAPALQAEVPAPLRLVLKGLSPVLPKLRVPSTIKGDQLSRDPAIGDAYFSDPLVFLKGTLRFGGALLDAMEAARSSIAAIDRPTLVVHGTDDTVVPPAASAALAASQHVERKMFPGIRHELHNEPESPEVLAYITRWIESRLDELAP